MAPGARGLFANFAIDENGHYLGHNGKDASLFDVLNELWKGMALDGDITMDEYENTNFPQYYRKKDEFADFFLSGPLNLISSTTVTTNCPYRAKFDMGNTDPRQFSNDLAGTVSSWSTGVFIGALNNSRSATEKQQIVDKLFDKFKNLVQYHPTRYSMDYVHQVICFSNNKNSS